MTNQWLCFPAVQNCALVALAATLCLATVAHAQRLPERDAASVISEGLRKQAERSSQQLEQRNAIADQLHADSAGGETLVLPDERPCFRLREIVLTGPDRLRFVWLQRSVERFLSQCVGARGLGLMLAHINARLTGLGYVTSRVTLEQQNLAAGRLLLHLDVGRVADIRMLEPSVAGQERVEDRRWGSWESAFAFRSGDVLNVRDLEQGLEQMKRLPSQDVTTLLEPGDAPGTSTVLIERSLGKRLRGGLAVDNSGNAAMGRAQFSVNLALDNLLALNDIASLGLNSNAEQTSRAHRSQSLNLVFSLPWGYGTFSFSASFSRFAQLIYLPTLSHLSSGRSNTAELKWQHVVFRTASSKGGVYAGVTTRASRSFVDDVELMVQRRDTTFGSMGVTLKQVLADRTHWELDLGYRRGVRWLGAQAELPTEPGSASEALTVRPRIKTLNLSLATPMPGATDWHYSASLRLQRSGNHMLSSDQMAIGGRGSVRGFDGEAVLIAENATVLRNEWRSPHATQGLQGEVYIGLDWGRVWGISDGVLPGRHLSGGALGWRGHLTPLPAVQWDLAWAVPISKPPGFKTSPYSFYASASYVL